MAKIPERFTFCIIDADGNEHDISAAVTNLRFNTETPPLLNEELTPFWGMEFSFDLHIDPIDVLVLTPPRNDAELS